MSDPGGPWKIEVIEADSASQADKFFRHNGYEMQTGTAVRLETESPVKTSQVGPAQAIDLRCGLCQFSLDGLGINRAHIHCPECGHRQHVIAWPGTSDEGSSVSWILGFLAIVGATTLFVLIPLVLVLAFSF